MAPKGSTTPAKNKGTPAKKGASPAAKKAKASEEEEAVEAVAAPEAQDPPQAVAEGEEGEEGAAAGAAEAGGEGAAPAPAASGGLPPLTITDVLVCDHRDTVALLNHFQQYAERDDKLMLEKARARACVSVCGVVGGGSGAGARGWVGGRGRVLAWQPRGGGGAEGRRVGAPPHAHSTRAPTHPPSPPACRS